MKEEFLKLKLDNMTLNEKIGQMIMIDYRNTLEVNNELENVLTKYQPGGFILFKSNVANYKQVKKLLLDIKEICNIKVLTSVDQEGGNVQRLDKRVGFRAYPPMMEIGNSLDEDMAYKIGTQMGSELKVIGIDMSMAPVLDIYSNSQNKVIGNRAFGTDPEVVKKMALAYASGLASQKIISVGKHFPGHGDTITDSHVNLPIIEKNIDELKKLELIPFVEAIKRNIPGLMVAHIAAPRVTNDTLPASLSHVMINDLLRDNLGYNGLIMPDSLKMKALSNYFDEKSIYLRCILAGNDVLLMPSDIAVSYNTIYEAVDSGIISIDQINDSVYRMINLKFEYGFFDLEYQKFVNEKNGEKLKTFHI